MPPCRTYRLVVLKLALTLNCMVIHPTSAAAANVGAGTGFLVIPDITAHRLLKVALDGSGQQELTAFRTGADTYSVLGAGRMLAVYRRSSSRTEKATVFDLASTRPLFAQDIPMNTIVSGPVFGKADHFVLRTYVGASDGNRLFVANLKSGDLATTLSSGGAGSTIDALPDGRLYRIHDTTGRISTSGPDGRWTVIGQLLVPQGMKIGNWRLNHAGTRIAIDYHWREASTALRSDVWVADIDGGNQHRLTQQGHMSQPVWSPDDQRVAFKYDTTSSLLSGGLGSHGRTGSCSYWHVPEQARNVSRISHGSVHDVAQELRVPISGVENLRVCRLIAWGR